MAGRVRSFVPSVESLIGGTQQSVTASKVSKGEKSLHELIDEQYESPLLFNPPIEVWPTKKEWIIIFAKSFLWALTFLVVRRLFLDFDTTLQVKDALTAALLGFGATFLRLIAEFLIQKNYIEKRFNDDLTRKND